MVGEKKENKKLSGKTTKQEKAYVDDEKKQTSECEQLSQTNWWKNYKKRSESDFGLWSLGIHASNLFGNKLEMRWKKK